MALRNFRNLLLDRFSLGNFVCVVLDPDWDKIPTCLKSASKILNAGDSAVGRTLIGYCMGNVVPTKNVAGAYLIDASCFVKFGVEGRYALGEVVRMIHFVAPNVPIILDANIGKNACANINYAREVFDVLDVDAITVDPTIGMVAMQPFLSRKDKGVFVSCRTSDEGSGEFQNLRVSISKEEAAVLRSLGVSYSHMVGGEFKNCYAPMSTHVAHRVAQHWNKNSNCGVVVGTSFPNELQQVRAVVGDIPILITGVGVNGGAIEKPCNVAEDGKISNIILNSFRGITGASSGDDYGEVAGK